LIEAFLDQYLGGFSVSNQRVAWRTSYSSSAWPRAVRGPGEQAAKPTRFAAGNEGHIRKIAEGDFSN
jgi:hypothetical protein